MASPQTEPPMDFSGWTPEDLLEEKWKNKHINLDANLDA